jgi:hypothetical protein
MLYAIDNKPTENTVREQLEVFGMLRTQVKALGVPIRVQMHVLRSC